MAIIIAAAENEFLREEVYSLRHRVFVEEQNAFKMKEDKKTSDPVDYFPSSLSHIGLVNSRPVASYRISLDNPFGFPLHSHYELNTIRSRTKDSKIGLISLGCIEKDVRSSGLFPLCVYQMGKNLNDNSCDHGAVVIRKDLSEAFSKWGFVPLEHFFCHQVKRWLSKMYVDVKDFGKNHLQFSGLAKVENFSRKMTLYLHDQEMFHFSQLENLNIKYSHVRLVSGNVKMFLGGLYKSILKPLDAIHHIQGREHLKTSVLSLGGKAEIEILLKESFA